MLRHSSLAPGAGTCRGNRPSRGLAALVATALTWLLAVSALYAQLDYNQRKSLKDAVYYLRQIEANLDQVTEQAKGADARTAPQVQANIDGLNKWLKYANDRLDKLPGEDSAVKAAKERAAAAAKAIGGLQGAVEQGAAESADAVRDEERQLADDIDKFKVWGQLFGSPQHQFDHKLEDALSAAGNLEEVKAEVAAIEERWPRLFDKKNRERRARDLKAAKSYFDRAFPPFERYVDNLRVGLPGKMEAHFTQIGTMVQTGVAEQRPQYFTGGIPQQVEAAERSLKIFEALDPAGAKPFAARLAALNGQIDTAQRDLSESIIQGNQVPQKRYSGPDIEELRALAAAAWAKENPGDTVLKIVFNTPGWSRVTRWQWSEGYKAWQKVDYSKIQPKIIVVHDARLAAVYPIDIYKDHMKGDRVHAKPWEKEENPDLRMVLLLDRVK